MFQGLRNSTRASRSPWRGSTVLVLATSLIAALLPALPSTAQVAETTQSSSETPGASSSLQPGDEVVDQRTRNSRTYVAEHGQLQTEIFTEAIHYKGDEGKWKAIDNTIVDSDEPGFSAENAGNAYSVLFPDDLSTGPIRLEDDEHWLEFQVNGATGAGVTSGSNRTYEDALPGVDLIYDVEGGALKETLKLESPLSTSSFSFSVHMADSLRPVVAGHRVSFLSPNDKEIFSFEAPFAFDSAGIDATLSGAVKLDIRKAQQGYNGVLEIDRKWLNSPGRAWPVYVDPTTTYDNPGKDCYIANGSNESTTSYCALSDLKIGYNGSNKRRTLIQFGQQGQRLDAIPATAIVSAAQLKLYLNNATNAGNSASIEVRRLQSAWTSSVTWSNSGSASWTGSDFGSTIWADLSLGGGATVSYKTWAGTTSEPSKLASLVQKLVDGTLTNYGLLLKQSSENVNNVLSFNSESASPTNPPTLVVTYNTPPGLPMGLTPADGAISTDTTPTLSATYNDVDANDDGHVKFEIQKSDGTPVASGDGTTVQPGQTSTYDVPALTSGTTYRWRAASYDGQYCSGTGLATCGTDGWTNWTTYRVNTPPGVPTGASPANNTVSDNTRPTLSATYVDPDSGDGGNVRFEIRKTSDDSLVASGDGTTVHPGQTSMLSYPQAAPSLQAGKSYYWRAASFDGDYCSGSGLATCSSDAWTSQVSYRANRPPDVPARLSPPSGAVSTDATPNLSGVYNDPDIGENDAPDDGYLKFEVRKASDDSLMASGNGTTVTPGERSTFDYPTSAPPLVAGVEYYWKAAAFDGDFCSGTGQATCASDAWSAHKTFILEPVVTGPVTYVHDANDRLVGVAGGNGAAAQYVYDAAGNITSIKRLSAASVKIIDFSPKTGVAGDEVTIYGTGFSTTAGDNSVNFNGVSATVQNAEQNRLVVSVPTGVSSGPLSLTTPNGTCCTPVADDFVVASTSAPTITSLSATSGVAGNTVTITGSGFDTSTTSTGPTSTSVVGTKVTFNGVFAEISSATSTQLTAKVPPGATSGLVTVRTAAGSVTADDFFVPPVNVVTGQQCVADSWELRDPYALSALGWKGRISGAGNTTTVASGEVAAGLFDGGAGDEVTLNVSNAASLGRYFLFVFAPDGTLIHADPNPTSADKCFPNSGTKSATLTLPHSGTYTAVLDPYGNGAGSATVSVSSGSGLMGLSSPAADRQASARTSVATELSSAAASTMTRLMPGAETEPSAVIPPSMKPSLERWRPSDREGPTESPWLEVPPRRSEPGDTALSGQVLGLDGRPLSGVTLAVESEHEGDDEGTEEDEEATTDDSGRFLIAGLDPGEFEFVIDGTTANTLEKHYGFFETRVIVDEGYTNQLPYTIWMPKLDTRHPISLRELSEHKVVARTPRIDGLELHFPQGSWVEDEDSEVVDEITITRIPLDRTPFPMQSGFPVYFTVQPGGAYVYPYGFRIVYPNTLDAPPGRKASFYNYDPEDEGWHRYGSGEVSADGKSIVPDRKTRAYEFSGASYLFPPLMELLGDLFGADPVDLATGVFVFEKTDMHLPGPLPVTFSRLHRQEPDGDRSVSGGTAWPREFGYESSHSYDLWLEASEAGTTSPTNWDLVLPGGKQIRFTRVTGSSTSWTAAGTNTRFLGSTLVKDPLWKLYHITLADGTKMQFAGAHERLTKIQDRFGNWIRINRRNGLSDQMKNITASSGRWLSFTNQDYCLTSVSDNLGRKVTYQYTGTIFNIVLSSVTDVNGKTTTYSYTNTGDTNIESITDPRTDLATHPNGITFVSNEYDGQGRVSEQTLADGSTYTFDYAPSGCTSCMELTDPNGVVRRVNFDADGYAVSDTRWYGNPKAQTYTYERKNSTHQVKALTDALGRRTELTYNTTFPQAIASITEMAGTTQARTTTYQYESAYGRVSAIDPPFAAATTVAYDDEARTVTLTDPATDLVRKSQMVLTSSGQPGSFKSKFDAATNTFDSEWQFSYSGADLSSITGPLGAVSTGYTDAGGRTLWIEDPLRNRTTFTHDPANLLEGVDDPIGGSTAFTYDVNGNVKTVDGPRTAVTDVTTFAYDVNDRLKTMLDPHGQQETYKYDGLGNVIEVTDRRGKKTIFCHDGLGRPKTIAYDASGNCADLTSSNKLTLTHDDGNRLRTLVDSVNGTIALDYDSFDRLTSESGPQGTVTYGYNDAARTRTTTVGSELAMTYGYDQAYRLATVTKGSKQAFFDYDAAGRVKTLGLPNGMSQIYSYDAASQVTGIDYKQGSTVVGSLSNSYDRSGRRSRVTGSYARTLLPPAVSSATYDAANRLTSWNGGAPLSYDPNGNLTDDGVSSYTWNARNELASVDGPVDAAFSYDGFGRRTSTQFGGGPATAFLYDGLDIARERLTNASGTTTAHFMTGAGLDTHIYREQSGPDGVKNRTFLTDVLGSPIALADDAGILKTETSYEPFGRAATTGEDPPSVVGFTGRESDATGLNLYRARYQSPTFGRFISEDPIGFAGGDVNLYAYVGSSPVNYTDPLGLYVDTALDIGSIGYDIQGILSGRKGAWGDLILDSIGALVPFVTGLGAGRHALSWADEAAVGGSRYIDDIPSSCLVNSFDGDTPVLMADGSTKPISEVKVGDEVMATDPETGRTRPKEVTNVIVGSGAKELVDVTVGGEVITATDGHPFYVRGEGWVDAEDLRPADKLRGPDGASLDVESVRTYALNQLTVYNLSVESFHTYHVGDEDVLVHNCASEYARRRLAKVDTGIPRSATPVAQGTSKEGAHWWEYVDSNGNPKLVVQHPDGSIHSGRIKAGSSHRQGGPPRYYNPEKKHF